MYAGVDVGGTYTDAVLLKENNVLKIAKIPTEGDLLKSILGALDAVLEGVDSAELERVVFSTTVITNLIAGRKFEKAALFLIPGPGLKRDYGLLGTDVWVLKGAIDYRGREIAPLDEKEIGVAVKEAAARGYTKVGVVGKFSPRNTLHEKKVASLIKEMYPEWEVELGSHVGPQLNFPRRIESTYLTCITREPYRRFIQSVKTALEKRGITAEAYILKADGGTFPLDSAGEIPVETIFSGPAASTLGVLALTPPESTTVVVDIGGTTTDLALILSGQPLLSSRGAKVEGRLTQVRALAVRSVPVGGDSTVEIIDGEVTLKNWRKGPAYCVGGPAPTPTDALRALGLTSYGDEKKAKRAMEILGERAGLEPDEVARKVIEAVVESITAEIKDMFSEWEQEPAYRVWEVLQKKRVKPNLIAGVGGGASGFLPLISNKMGLKSYIPPYAEVANAIGAAVAMPTIQVNLRADTEQGFYIIQEEGYQGSIGTGVVSERDVLLLAKEWLLKRAKKLGLCFDLHEVEIIRKEMFNMVRGWNTAGRLFDITVQTPRGIKTRIAERGDSK